MPKTLPYFKWYPADAETDENFKTMTDAQVGFFMRCLNHSWINGGIPADPQERANIFRVERSYADAQWERVGKCFIPSDGDPARLVNPRQEEERRKAQAKRESAERSAKQRWRESTDCGSASAMRSHNERNANGVPRAYDSESVFSSSESESENPDSETRARVELAQQASEPRSVSTPNLPRAFEFDCKFKKIIGIFLAHGAEMSDCDNSKCYQEWDQLTDSEQELAVAYAEGKATGEWRTTETRYIPRPLSYLREKHWERKRAGPNGRILPKVSDRDLSIERAAGIFEAQKRGT